jgi:hypothetical protein
MAPGEAETFLPYLAILAILVDLETIIWSIWGS